MMLYTSTESDTTAVRCLEAVERCIPPGGGLYMPQQIPAIPVALFNNIAEMSLRDIAYGVASSFLGNEIPAGEIKQTVDYAFAADAPLVHLGGNSYALELFHGPTLTFKDYGARFVARLLAAADRQAGRQRRTVLVATTGNSGAATANGMLGQNGTDVLVLYPKGALSRTQKSQFSTLGRNVHPLEVDGTIEDCKRLVAEAIADKELEYAGATSANSLNIGRMIPQIVFSLHAYARMMAAGVLHASEAVYAIPSGNLSNLVATLMAVKMGLPAKAVVAATNTNDSLRRSLTGDTTHRPVPTVAPSLDISLPAGLSRLTYMCGKDLSKAPCPVLVPPGIDDRTIASTVLRLKADNGYTIDTHGATALAAALATAPAEAPKLVFATGHPAKNLDIMTRITGSTIELPVQLTRFMASRRRFNTIPPTLAALRKYIGNIGRPTAADNCRTY